MSIGASGTGDTQTVGMAATPHRRKGRGLWVIGSVLAVIGVGAGAFAIAHAVSAPSVPAGSTAPAASASGRASGASGARTGAPAIGVVQSVSTASFTLKETAGTVVTVDVSSTTTYRDRAVTSAGYSDVKSGATVSVDGSRSGNTVHATAVTIGRAFSGGGDFGGFGGHGSGGAAPSAFGTVSSVGTSSFVVHDRTGSSLTVEVSGSTTYEDRGASSASLADVKTGDTVIVAGTVSGSTVQAKSVTVLPAGFGSGGGGGGFGGFGRGGGGGDSTQSATAAN